MEEALNVDDQEKKEEYLESFEIRNDDVQNKE